LTNESWKASPSSKATTTTTGSVRVSYFWEANPLRGLDFAREAKKGRSSNIKKPFVIGAVISLGLCLDLTTAAGIEQVRAAHKSLVDFATAAGLSVQAFFTPRGAG
jgi:hypothetical protein